MQENWKHIGSTCAYPVSAFVSYDTLSPTSQSFVASLDSVVVPKSVAEAIVHPGWQKAMKEEMMALEQNHTWDLVKLPPGKKSIGC